jgi:hypothetical protein
VFCYGTFWTISYIECRSKFGTTIRHFLLTKVVQAKQTFAKKKKMLTTNWLLVALFSNVRPDRQLFSIVRQWSQPDKKAKEIYGAINSAVFYERQKFPIECSLY